MQHSNQYKNAVCQRINRTRALAEKTYALFKKTENKDVKRKAGLMYLRLQRDIREALEQL